MVKVTKRVIQGIDIACCSIPFELYGLASDIENRTGIEVRWFKKLTGLTKGNAKAVTLLIKIGIWPEHFSQFVTRMNAVRVVSKVCNENRSMSRWKALLYASAVREGKDSQIPEADALAKRQTLRAIPLSQCSLQPWDWFEAGLGAVNHL